MRHSASAFQLGGSAPVLGSPGGGGRAAGSKKSGSSSTASSVLWPLANVILLGVVAHFALDNSYAAPTLPTSRSTSAEDAFREGGVGGASSSSSLADDLLFAAAAAGGPAPSAAPGTAGADYSCDAAASSSSSPWDADGLTASLRASLRTAYLNDTTTCEQLGPTCVAEGGHLVLYDPALQPANGTYRHLDGKGQLPVLAALRRVMHLVGWGGPGGGNPDVWNGNIRTFDGETVHAWPAGPGATPPVPFSACTHPVALFWDFPENFWHTLAVYSAVWAAVTRHGALADDVTLALGLPPSGVTHVPEYLYAPLLAAVTRGAVATLGHLGAHGVTHARAVGAAPAAGAGGGSSSSPPLLTSPPDHRVVAVPPARCFAKFTLCSLAGYHALPPPAMFDFMQALKRALLARVAAAAAGAEQQQQPPPAAGGSDAASAAAQQRQAYADALADMGPPPPPPPRAAAAAADAAPTCAWPPGRNYVTGPGGVLRVTLAMRKEGTRRVLNADELLAACKEAGRVALGDFSSTSGGAAGAAAAAASAPTVSIACEAYRFGSGPGGMADDALRMHNTDVLVAVHGAGLTNLGFLRPGAIVVEIRPLGFDAANADRFYRPLARRSGCLKWWGLLLHEPYQQPGAMQAARRGNPSKYTRDRDLLVPWEGVAAAIGSAAGTSYDGWLEREGRALTHVM